MGRNSLSHSGPRYSPPLRSSFAPLNENGRSDAQDNEGRALLAAATLIASCLGRFEQDGFDARGFSVLLSNTLGARSLTARIDPALRWLTDPSRAIAYRNEQGRYHLTVLGNAGVRAMLPLTYLAAVGQLIRDLMSLDPEMKVLRRWSALDHLFVAALVSVNALPRYAALARSSPIRLMLGLRRGRPKTNRCCSPSG